MSRICMQCGLYNNTDCLLCQWCRKVADEHPQASITQLAQNNAVRQNIIEEMAKLINELNELLHGDEESECFGDNNE